jgi:hypothetical protein
MPHSKRKRYLVDPRVQVPLLARMAVYGFAYLGAICVLIAVQVALSSPAVDTTVLSARIAVAFGPALLASLFVLPLVLFDCVRFSNRFAGPMKRLQRSVQQLVDEGQAERMVFRRDDFWFELAEQFNRLADRIEELEQAQGSGDRSSDLAAATR